jgi:hypothetical protein
MFFTINFIISFRRVAAFLARPWLSESADFQQARHQWVSEALRRQISGALGDFTLAHKVKSELAFQAMHRRVTEVTGTYTFREDSEPYSASFTAES